MDENATPPTPPPPVQSTPPPQWTAPPASTPPLIASLPPSRPRKSRGWMVLSIILLLLLGISFLLNVGHFASSMVHGKARVTRTVGPKLEEVVVEENDAANKIAIVEITGIITSRGIDQSGYSMVDIVKAALKNAEEDDHVKAVLLKVDSPGGEVLASDEIYHEISHFQSHSSKPVIASMGNLAASGGYYVSAPCRWIVANDLTITGSIGVIMHSYNYRGLMDKVGLKPETYKSGKFKDMLSGDRSPEEVLPEEREMLQNMINETYNKFKSVVAAGRKQASDKNKGHGRNLSDDWTSYADGRVLSGTDAFKLGFVDQLGNFEDAVNQAKSIAGISAANLVEYRQHYDLSDLFRMFGKTEAPSIKVDLGIDPPKLQTGQLYFLSPTFAH